MFEVYTVYNSLPELYLEVGTEEEAKELVNYLMQNPLLSEAYYSEVKK